MLELPQIYLQAFIIIILINAYFQPKNINFTLLKNLTMNTIKIKNVGPIKDICLDLNKVNIIMGPQSSGKSTIAKIVSYCQWVEKRYILDGEFKYSFEDQFIEFHRTSKAYFSDDSIIEYNSDSIFLSYSGISNDQILEKKDNSKFINSKNIYIPAERNFVSTIENLGKYKRKNDNIMNFLYDWYEVKKKYTSDNKYSILNLGISYYHEQEHDSDLLVLSENQKELNLSNASSGLQSVLPMLLIVDYLTNGLYTEKTTESVDEKEEFEKMVKIFVKDFFDKMENDEKRKAFEEKIQNDKMPFKVDELIDTITERMEKMKYNYSSIIIEEPEQNLYPKTQRDLIYYIFSLINNSKRDHRLLLTTHSPFVLYAINNCMLGGFIKDKLSEEDTFSYGSRKSWIDPQLVSVWEIEEGKGTLRNIKDVKTGTINDNYFNSIMNEVMSEYYEMLTHI